MKIHRPLVLALEEAVRDIFLDQRYADKVVDHNLKRHREWGSRDRRFFAEQIYEIVRWQRRLLWCLDATEISVLNISSLVDLQLLRAGHELPDWRESEISKDLLKKWALAENEPATISQSYPDWIDQEARQQIGDQRWASISKALNEKSTVDLRVNLSKAKVEDVVRSLRSQEIKVEVVDAALGTLTLVERANVFITKDYEKGLIEVQDRASQQVGLFLELKPGLRVIDSCAGAGGKSLHMADLMKNQGKIIALDIHAWKLDELSKRSRRQGWSLIETRPIESTKTLKRLDQSADRVLTDVPCSGLGVLRRHPDTKWKLTREELGKTIELQQKILQDNSRMVKPGGLLVYSTCTWLPQENEAQVEKFLNGPSGSDFELLDQWRIWPDEQRGDGFFAAKFRRKSAT